MNSKYNFGNIVEVPIREVWNGEASDFTPWLASEDGLQRLGSLISRNLTLVGTEVYIGKYRADIIAKDEHDEYYVIENKFESMDHDHLGKSLVYVAGYEPRPSHVIIIVESVTPEHTAALEMLNALLDGKIDFTFLEIHARKIDNSPIVPFFEVKVQPLGCWTNSPKKGKDAVVDNLYKEFFDSFQEYAKTQREFVDFVGLNPLNRPNVGRSFMDLISRNGISFSISATMKTNDIKASIYIRRENDVVNAVDNMIDDIKHTFGDSLVISDNKNLMLSSKLDFNINEHDNWETAFKWYCDAIKQWKHVLEQILK